MSDSPLKKWMVPILEKICYDTVSIFMVPKLKWYPVEQFSPRIPVANEALVQDLLLKDVLILT